MRSLWSMHLVSFRVRPAARPVDLVAGESLHVWCRHWETKSVVARRSDRHEPVIEMSTRDFRYEICVDSLVFIEAASPYHLSPIADILRIPANFDLAQCQIMKRLYLRKSQGENCLNDCFPLTVRVIANLCVACPVRNDV